MCYINMDTNKDTIVETNQAIIQRYIEAYNKKKESIFDENRCELPRPSSRFKVQNKIQEDIYR